LSISIGKYFLNYVYNLKYEAYNRIKEFPLCNKVRVVKIPIKISIDAAVQKDSSIGVLRREKMKFIIRGEEKC